jgi:hypothetical protein
MCVAYRELPLSYTNGSGEHQPNINDVLHSDTQSSLSGGSRTLIGRLLVRDRVVCATRSTFAFIIAHPHKINTTICIHEGSSSKKLSLQERPLLWHLLRPHSDSMLRNSGLRTESRQTVSCLMNQCVVSCDLADPLIECCDVRTADGSIGAQ